jgi:site-specific DNA recombinase
MAAARQRCAIYTRKSSEEGLEQGFNSLHAQREACEAYVLSQAGEGWTAIRTVYDDGGFSGGSMERPGLQALLADIERGQIDVVVVYKVDRLTRSLADFAKIIEQFDAKGVSFVSVTQAFNTTSSMGRLTLNVLLSFAQFEREVTAERIRDKVAASKAKGLWMGGRLPLGYDVADHRLVINLAEAETVRAIIRLYLDLGTVRLLQAALARDGVRSKVWTNRRDQLVGGNVLTRGALYHLLSNPVYRGAIRHKDRVFPDAHPAIIDEETWNRVQNLISGNTHERSSTPRSAPPVLLKGLVVDDAGNPMVAVHTAKGATRYRYYVSTPLQDGRADAQLGSLPRVAMAALEQTVIGALEPRLRRSAANDAPPDRVQAALQKVVVGMDRLELTVDAAHLDQASEPDAAVAGPVVIVVPIRLKRRQSAMVIEAGSTPEPARRVDRALVRAVVLARRWARRLEEGSVGSVKELARLSGLCEHYTARLLPLAYLAPDLTTAILQGMQPAALSLKKLTGAPLPLDWDGQRRLFAG